MRLPYKFGKYVLVKKIAQGGMAEIYKAKYKGERGFAKEVAVKRILPLWSHRREFEDMLIDEAKALVHLQHQNIVQVFELGRDGDFFFISMEYVDGVDLRHLVNALVKDRLRLPEKFACYIIGEVLKGLEFAHRQKDENGRELNIVHRDISPQNILLSFNGEVKLTDFGIAKGLHRESETTTAKLKGKYAYMSPEQAQGQPIDSRSDLYSAGITFFELLTGMRCFYSGSDFDTICRVRESKMPDLWEARVALNARLMIKKALAKDAGARYRLAVEFLNDLNNYMVLRKYHTHNLELAAYLASVFPNGRGEEDAGMEEGPGNTKVLSQIKKRDVRKDRPPNLKRYAAAFFAMIPLAAAGFSHSVVTAPKVQVKGLPVERADGPPETPAAPIRRPEVAVRDEGLIDIDTEPSGVSGVITYNGIRRDFKTPFVLAGLKLVDGIDAHIKIENDGFEGVTDNFSLSSNQPVFARRYRLTSTAPATLSVQARPWGYVYVPGVAEKIESPVHSLKLKPGGHIVKVLYTPTNTWAKANLDAEPGRHYRCTADFTKGAAIRCR